MKRSILAAKRLEAHRALHTAIRVLAKQSDLTAPELDDRPPVRELDWLRRDEALADFFDQLVAVEPAVSGFTAEEVLAVDGLTKTSREALEAFFAESGDTGGHSG